MNRIKIRLLFSYLCLSFLLTTLKYLAQREADPAASAPFDLYASDGTLEVSTYPFGFGIFPITEAIQARIYGISYREGCPVDLGELRYLRILHIGFDREIHEGELIVHQAIAEAVLDIFSQLYLAGYPIERMVLIDEYGADDEASMTDNNTSAFCFRPIAGADVLSLHSYGLAVDINPLYNPHVRGTVLFPTVSPYDFESRTVHSPYFLTENDYCVQLFLAHGFSWGGNWDVSKDYQHFEYSIISF